MSLLLEALKKAERAKEEAQRRSRGETELTIQTTETPPSAAADEKPILTRAELPDIVLCDYALPSFDALAALAILKREHVDLPFIIVSGTMHEEAAVRAMKAGASDFFKKDNCVVVDGELEVSILPRSGVALELCS